MRKLWLNSSLALLLLAAGCTDMEQGSRVQDAPKPDAGQISYGLFGPGPLNYDGIRNHRMNPYQGEDNTTGTSFKTLTRNKQTLESDQVSIRRFIAANSEFDPGMALMAGSHVWVNVKAPKDMKDKDKKLSELKKALKAGIPRYQIHLLEKGG